jgi:hypothetical protein
MMTCAAVMVVPLVVPRTRTLTPVVMALAEVELVPFWNSVEDASLTVTVWPVDVDIVKPDVETLPTVPAAPPAAGPDRALDAPPPDRGPPEAPLGAAVAEGDVAVAAAVPHADRPISAHIGAAAMTHRLLLCDSNRRCLGRRGFLTTVAEADESGEDAAGPDVALEAGRAGPVWWGFVGL